VWQVAETPTLISNNPVQQLVYFYAVCTVHTLYSVLLDNDPIRARNMYRLLIVTNLKLIVHPVVPVTLIYMYIYNALILPKINA
jgi:hypothetical protein